MRRRYRRELGSLALNPLGPTPQEVGLQLVLRPYTLAQTHGFRTALSIAALAFILDAGTLDLDPEEEGTVLE